MKSLTFISFVLILFFSTHSVAQSNDTKALENKIAMLYERIDQVKSEIALWRDTEKHLSSAEQLLNEGNVQQANELIKIVELQLSNSLAQAQGQTDINQLIPYYLKD